MEPNAPYKIYLINTSNSLIKNGDGIGTTSWVDTDSDGVADDWIRTGTAATCTIINGTDGFSGRAQKFVANRSISAYFLYVAEQSFSQTNGVTYNYSFKYKSNIGLSVGYPIGPIIDCSVTASPSSVTTASGSYTASRTGMLFFMMTGVASIDDWAIIDEITWTVA